MNTSNSAFLSFYSYFWLMAAKFDLQIRDDEIGRFFGEEYAGKIFIRRLDLIHPEVSGNKWFKLKYNIQEAKNRGCNTVVSFGGAYSNHLAALATVAKINGVNSAGIIRGEEPEVLNDVLSYLKLQGMELIYVDRSKYKNRNDPKEFSELLGKFDTPFLIPEGGANEPGVRGAEEIISTHDELYSYILIPVGTGTTMAGIINSSIPSQQIIGVSSLKGSKDYLENLVREFLGPNPKTNWFIDHEHHFGGFGKSTNELVDMIKEFRSITGINTEHVYTAKMLFALKDMLPKMKLDTKSKILLIHSGGFRVNS